jgi:serine/threonine protein kinase/tetratricopeptide (TPR) repeat protein
MIGQTVSHYKILEKLGEGGMGVVYKAEDLALKRRVALKFLPQHLQTDESARKRFIHEAQAASALEHNHICTIHEIGETDQGQIFIAMPSYDGETLQERIAKGHMPVDAVLDIAIQVTRGLSKAHEKDIIHRDIKPANIFVTSDGAAKVMDFGLAKLTGGTRVTRTGMTVGTVAYMSPEQARGEETDARTDIWSLGVVLYQMLTGALPFRGDADQAVVYSILNTEPELITGIRRDVPAALENVVEKMLAKDPAKRFQAAVELLDVLERQRESLDSGTSTRRFPVLKRFRRNRRAFWGSLATLVITITAVSTALFYTPGEAIDSIAVLPVSNLSGDPDQEWLSGGITMALINELGKISAFEKVVSRTSVMQYKDAPRPLSEIARELGVKAVVEGAVLRAGDRVNVTVQLIQADNERPLWGDSFERDFTDILSIYKDVTSAIANEIRIVLTPGEEASLARRETVDPRAYEAYLTGRMHAARYTEDEMRKGLEYFRDAIEYDSTYAEAWAALSYTYAEATWYFMSPEESYPNVRAAARKALELDNRLAESHVAQAMIRNTYDWDWEGAEAAYRRALELDPRNEPALLYYAGFLTFMRRGDEAIEMIRRAVDQSPLSVECRQNMGWVYYHARRYDDAIAAYKKTLELLAQSPDSVKEVQLHRQLMWCYIVKRMFDEAFTELTQVEHELRPDSHDHIWLYVASGRRDEIAGVIEEVLAKDTAEINPWILAMLGENDRAIERLQQLYEQHDTFLFFASVDVIFDDLRSDPRFQELMRRANFPR